MSEVKNLNLYMYADDEIRLMQSDYGYVGFSTNCVINDDPVDYKEEFAIAAADAVGVGGIFAIFPQEMALPALNMAADMLIVAELESRGITIDANFAKALKHVGVFREYCLNVLLHLEKTPLGNICLANMYAGFTWADTPKGETYWRDIKNKVNDYMKIN